MTRRLKFGFFFGLFSLSLTSQINLDITTQDASCSGKGSIRVTAAGGKVPYSYEITDNTCGLNNRPLQSNQTFSGLSSCTYTIRVIDADGRTAIKNAIVGGNYIGPSASILVDGCGFVIRPKNGNSPLNYSISTDGGNTFSPSSNQNIYNGLSNGTYYIKIEDACNSVFISSATIALDPLEYIFIRAHWPILTDSIVPDDVKGGQGPFQFYIVNANDTLKSPYNTFAIKDIIKTCSTKVVVVSACGTYVNEFNYVDADLVCLDLTKGEAEIKVNLGVPPYISFYYPDVNTGITTAGLIFSGLRKNEYAYKFAVKDQCQHFSFGNYGSMERVRPGFRFKTSTTCNNLDSITVEIVQDEYLPGSTYTVECKTCIPLQQFNNIKKSVTIHSLNPGNKIITLTDSCGSLWTCTSEPFIHMDETCESIKLHLINAFFCDNRPESKTYTGDIMVPEMFYLRSAEGLLIDSNNRGEFKGMANGQYLIQARSSTCGIVSRNYTRNIIMQPPSYSIDLNLESEYKGCRYLYHLRVDPDYSPYALIDSANQSLGFEQPDPESFITFRQLSPGTYILKSLLNCWQREIVLPKISPKIKLEQLTICPAGGSVTINGGKSFEQWQEYYNTFGLTFYGGNHPADWYNLTDRISKFNYDTASHSYFNIEPGKTYTIYLYSFAAVRYNIVENTCPVDSFTFSAPFYTPPNLISDLTLKCDQSNSILHQLKLKNGTGPYQIQEINCNSQNNIGNSLTTSDSIVNLSTTGNNNPCFKMTDACQNSTITESSVSDLTADIQVIKNCNATTTFYFSAIPGATYTWRNKMNAVIGNQSSITTPDPKVGDEVKLSLVYSGCTIAKLLIIDSLTVRNFNVRIDANKSPDLCFGDSIQLTAIISGGLAPFQYKWTNGSEGNTTWLKTSGIQILVATNSIGCHDTAEINIRIGEPLKLLNSKKPIACFGDSTGLIKIQPLGGIAPYQYLWSTGSIADSIKGLTAGQYGITITDAANCHHTENIPLEQNSKLILLSKGIAATCSVSKDGSAEIIPSGGASAYSYQWNSGQKTSRLININPGNYSVTVTDQVLCQAQASIEVMRGPAIQSQRTDTICSGSSLLIGPSIYSISGNFRDTLKTFQGCDSIVMTRLTVNAPLQYTFTSLNPICSGQNNGSITVSKINGKPPFIFELNGRRISGLKADNLTSGNYTIKVTDAFVCSTEKGTALTNPQRLELEAGKDTLLQFGDSIVLRVITNIATNEIKSITWNSDQGPICINCTTKSLRPKKDITIKVELENKAGCKITDQFLIKVNLEFKVFTPNVIHANPFLSGAGPNSRFTLFGNQQVLEIEYLRIFDRYGSLLFEKKNIPPGDLQYGWDGTFKNIPVAAGVYVYIASVRFANESVKIVSGDVTVIN